MSRRNHEVALVNHCLLSKPLCFSLVAFFLSLLAIPSSAQDAGDLSADSLKQLSIEALLDVEVFSVSRRQERLSEAASAIQVITRDDIRRSGATNLPEALRLAGNIHVAQKNSSGWAISTRGFNTDLANKLLVLIDGRTVYTPLFSGVFWDRQDYLLEDIERIEVVSGPGGTLWGANAVNGVINIITRNSKDTQGLYAEAGGGTQLRTFGGVRYGGAIGSHATFRVYGKYFDRDNAILPDGEEPSDAWHMGQAGFRMEVEPSSASKLTFQGDYYGGDEDLATGGNNIARGGNFLARWSRNFSETSSIQLRIYYDKTYLDQDVPRTLTDDNFVLAPEGTLKDVTDTYDLDFQHTLQLGKGHQIVWGFGYRHTHDDVENAPALAFIPEELDLDLFSVFAQDKLMMSENSFLTFGTKVEHNDYTGIEVEPSVRVQHNFSGRQALWAAVSRAVRMPSRIDRHVRLPTPAFSPIIENLLVGGENFISETLIAYELGYRAQISSTLSGSVSGFYNVYDDVRSTSLSPPDPIAGLPFPLFYENNLEGETYGAELTITWQALHWWKVHTTYTRLETDIRVSPGEYDFNNALNENADPRHIFGLRSSMDLPSNLELDAGLRWIDEFEYNMAGTPGRVAGYTELEMRLGWNVTPQFELSVVGQSLLHDHHLEYALSGAVPRTEIERSVYGKIAYRF